MILQEEPVLPLTTRVSYIPDPRVTGTVVGYGTVHNGADSGADGEHAYSVLIVKMDEPLRSDSLPSNMTFHVPFVRSVLNVTWVPGEVAS